MKRLGFEDLQQLKDFETKERKGKNPERASWCPGWRQLNDVYIYIYMAMAMAMVMYMCM